MKPEQVRQYADELVEFHKRFARLFYEKRQAHWAGRCLHGLLLDGVRKNAAGLACAVPGGNVQSMQQFLSDSPWDPDPVVAELQALVAEKLGEPDAVYSPVATSEPAVDFSGDSEVVRVVAEGERLAYGHLFNPAFATETSLIHPLPHQHIAVYEHMLPQTRLRFLLADDAGAGKTIMTGLYVREMLSRSLVRRILIVPPAGPQVGISGSGQAPAPFAWSTDLPRPPRRGGLIEACVKAQPGEPVDARFSWGALSSSLTTLETA